MLAILVLLAGIVTGYVLYRRKRKIDNPYQMSAGAAWWLWSAIGIAAAFGCLLVPNILPRNDNQSEKFDLIPISRLVDGETRDYYILENYNTKDGRVVHSWIVDTYGETVLRSDFSLAPANIIPQDTDDATITYTTTRAYYPWISPLAIQDALPVATAHVPDGSVFQNFHLSENGQ